MHPAPATTDHVMPIIARPAQVMARGAGSWLWDTTGTRYLDLLQGWAVNTLGHAPPSVATAIARQAETLLTPSPLLDIPGFAGHRVVRDHVTVMVMRWLSNAYRDDRRGIVGLLARDR